MKTSGAGCVARTKADIGLVALLAELVTTDEDSDADIGRSSRVTVGSDAVRTSLNSFSLRLQEDSSAKVNSI